MHTLPDNGSESNGIVIKIQISVGKYQLSVIKTAIRDYTVVRDWILSPSIQSSTGASVFLSQTTPLGIDSCILKELAGFLLGSNDTCHIGFELCNE